MTVGGGGGRPPGPTRPTFRRRALANALRRLRQTAGMNLESAATALEVSVPTMSRYETGVRVPRARDVRELCRLYGATEKDTASVLALVSDAKETGWWESYSEAEDFGISTFLGFETAASAIEQYSQNVIPGLLQTAEYAQAMYETSVSPALAAPMTSHDVSKMVEIRLKRQSRLHAAGDLDVSIVLDEAALRRVIGGPRILRGQLLHLVEASTWPSVKLRLLPFSSGGHPGQFSGGFVILTIRHSEVPDIVQLESLVGYTFVDADESVDRHRQVFRRLNDQALTERSSRDKISEIVTRL